MEIRNEETEKERESKNLNWKEGKSEMRKQKFSFLGENFGDPSPSGDAFDIHAFTQHTLSSSQIYHPFLYHLIIGVRT